MGETLRRDPLPSTPVDDAALVAEARTGSERAFTALYRRHARYVAGVVYRLMGSDGELDDIVQEAFVDALHGLDGLTEPEKFRPWLVTIAVRRVHRRLESRHRLRTLKSAVGHVMPRHSDPNDRQRVDALYAALDRISAKVRIPWVLHVIEGESLPEVARCCGVSLATVKRQIAEAGEKIERRLHEER